MSGNNLSFTDSFLVLKTGVLAPSPPRYLGGYRDSSQLGKVDLRKRPIFSGVGSFCSAVLPYVASVLRYGASVLTNFADVLTNLADVLTNLAAVSTNFADLVRYGDAVS